MKIPPKYLFRIIGPILFAWLIYKSDPARIWSYLSKIDPWLPLVALIVSWVALFLKSLRWRSLLVHTDPNLTVGQAFAYYAGGTFWGSITPGKVGEFAKAKYLKGRGIRYTHGIASIIIDRILDVFLLFCTAIVPLLILFGIPRIQGNEPLILCIGLAFIVLVGIGLGSWAKRVGGKPEIENPSLAGYLSNAMQWVHQIPLRAWLLALGLGVAATFVFLFQRVILAWSLDLDGEPFFYAGAIAAAALLSALPITVQGVGTRDATLVYMLNQIDVSREEALALSQLILLVMIVNTGISRLIFMKSNHQTPYDRTDRKPS